MHKKTIGFQNPHYALEHWVIWFTDALTQLQTLHSNRMYHGFLDESSCAIHPETNRLELLTKKTTQSLQIPPTPEEWNPAHSVYPPERLLVLGTEAGYALTTLYELLEERNPSIDFILQQFDLDYSFRVFRTIQKSIYDPEKADIWMLGLVFLRTYIQYLTWPGVMQTEFYKSEHERFMNCLGRMLSAYPYKRPSCSELLELWLSQTGSTSESDSESICEKTSENDVLTNSDPVVPEPASSVSDSSETCVILPSLAQQTPKPRLLALSGYHDPVARNKTRRSLHNSSRNPATRSHGKHAQD